MVRQNDKIHLIESFFGGEDSPRSGFGDLPVSQNSRRLYEFYSLKDRFWVVHAPFCSIVQFQSLAQFPIDLLSTQSCLVLYFFRASLLHLIIVGLTVSYFSPT